MLAEFRMLSVSTQPHCPRVLVNGQQGSQIVEFAVALPLLILVMIGISDFSGAFNLKQRLASSAAATARLAAEQSPADLGSASPPSVIALRNFVAQSLTAAGLSDCGLGSAAATSTGTLQWTYTGGTCTSNATLVVERGYNFSVVAGGSTVQVIATRVTLNYPYQWRFGNVVKLISPSATFAGPTTLSVISVVPNLS
jgi:Flp pilus assembly protein TadG